MSHSRTPGRFFVTHIGSYGNEALIELSKASEISFDNEHQEITDVGDAGNRTYLDGIRSWSTQGEINYDQSDSELADLIDRIINPTISTQKSVIIGQQSNSGDIAWRGYATISNIKISGIVNGIVIMTFIMQGNIGSLRRLTKQYDYYSSDLQYNAYSGIGVAETYYDGTTYVRKVIQSGLFKRQISTDVVNWSDLDPTYTLQNDGVRNGVRDGKFVTDATITATGFEGVKDTDWETLEEITTGGTGKFREGVRNGAYVIDQALTALGFDGIENTDWENIIEMKIT